MEPGWSFALVLAAASLFSALAALLVASYLPAWPRPVQGRLPDTAHDDTVFLFDDDFLVDATPRARRLLAQGQKDLSDWNRLVVLLSPRFPDFASRMSKLAETGIAVLDEVNGNARIRAIWTGGVARISLLESDSPQDQADIDVHSLSALQAELELLRRLTSRAPVLAWQQNGDGGVVWANRGYMDLLEQTLEDDQPLVWPLPSLFRVDGYGEPEPRRQSVKLGDGSTLWFDCSAAGPLNSRLFFAAPADATVRAEGALRDFTQTLAKTFANLPTGLAIFNRSRSLVMFNPALIDLCHLEPQFLAQRPTMFSFLDRLREQNMIPETRDYLSWRQRMAELEASAESGVFEEVWTLPSGQTYKVTGRPHPDGALAFLFEDISSEVSLTRGFRAELELGQAVLDSLADAVAVFTPGGTLALSNAAYSHLWESDPSTTLGEISIRDATERWAQRCESTGLWDRLRQFVGGLAPRDTIFEEVELLSGERLICRAKAISGGATLVSFSLSSPVRDAHQPERRNSVLVTG